jgi:hypothetical protein
MRIVLAVSIACLATLAAQTKPSAQTQPAVPQARVLSPHAPWPHVLWPHVSSLGPVATYKPLTTWDRIKLGAAYFTDPHRVRTIQFAYEYDPTSFPAGEHKATLTSLAKEGQISCTLTGYDPSSLVDAFPCQQVPDFPWSSDSFKIISPRPSLLETQPSNVLVKEEIPEPQPRPNVEGAQK